MKIHLLNKNCCQNAFVPPENMKDISRCGKEVNESQITTDTKNITCKSCLKLIKF